MLNGHKQASNGEIMPEKVAHTVRSSPKISEINDTTLREQPISNQYSMMKKSELESSKEAAVNFNINNLTPNKHKSSANSESCKSSTSPSQTSKI